MIILMIMIIICCCPVTKSCPTLCDSMDCSPQDTLSFTISQSVLKLMPSNHLILCHPLLFLPSIFLSISVFSNESAVCISWPKYWNFSFSINLCNEHSGLISIRIDWFDSWLFKKLRRVFSNTTVQKHQFFGAQPSLWSNSHIHT